MKKCIYRPYIYTTIFLFSLCAPNFIYAYLATSGRVFVSTSGDTVQLRGFGLGGWLVQEGYMWNTSGFYGSTTEIENQIISLVGDSATSAFYQNYYSTYITEEDIVQLSEWGFNSLRSVFPSL